MTINYLSEQLVIYCHKKVQDLKKMTYYIKKVKNSHSFIKLSFFVSF